MTFEAIYAAAVEVVNQITAGGETPSPDKTVCVICSGSGRIYYGVSRADIHAEVDALRNMQGMGENKVDTMILIDSLNRTAMLPCNNCVGFILSQNPENAQGSIAMPDRLIPLSEVGMYAGGGTAPPGGGFSAPPPGKNIHAKGDLLKNRVGAIMQGVDDDDDDEEEEEEKPRKKKFFGLFG